MAKVKRLNKINIEHGNEIKAIYFRYFISIGLYVESKYDLGTEESTAAFLIKFGKNEYRRAAWLAVRSKVERQVSPVVYSILNNHFSIGKAENFTHAFDHQTRMHLKTQSLLKSLS
jgi:hypothetical protein